LTVSRIIESQLATESNRSKAFVNSEKIFYFDESKEDSESEEKGVVDNAFSPLDNVENYEVSSILNHAMTELYHTDREIVLRISDGASFSQAAKLFKMSPATVKKRYLMALRRLRKTIMRIES
jgi:DNA-directed RNA polymerase specialized sigma24 family protein